jgi:hypothetical protein
MTRIKSWALASVAGALLSISAAQAQQLTLPLPPPKLPPLNLHDTPPSTVTAALAAIPPDVRGLRDQFDFDVFAWREFVALNWPAVAKTCSARADATLVDDSASPRVWETWKTPGEIFVPSPSAQQPRPWCPQASPAQNMLGVTLQLSAAVSAAFVERLAQSGVGRVLSDIVQASSHALPEVQQAVGGPLVDQNGRFVRYEERVNADEFAFLLDNQLWSIAGQTRYRALHGAIQLPSGVNGAGVGAIEVKAAWKVLDAGELASARFYSVKALVTTGFDASGKPQTEVVDAGLIGFHIAHKTQSSPQWSWATFEHVDNLAGSLRDPGCGTRLSCIPYLCVGSCCPDNCQTVRCQDQSCPELEDGAPLNDPVQVKRVQDVAQMALPDHDVGAINSAFQRLLAGSVWANYALISNQWPSQPNQDGGVPQPPFLANIALETFNQGPSPTGSDGAAAYPGSRYDPSNLNVSSSCMKCHSKGSDFSFLLGHAH